MSLFVSVHVDEDRCRSGQPCTACAGVCPVSIFEIRGGLAAVVGEEEDPIGAIGRLGVRLILWRALETELSEFLGLPSSGEDATPRTSGRRVLII